MTGVENSLSFWQGFFKAILPKSMFDEMEKESRLWMVQCSNCKYERSIWDIGGIRWKAAGDPKVLRLCPNCNQKNWHQIYRKTQ